MLQAGAVVLASVVALIGLVGCSATDSTVAKRWNAVRTVRATIDGLERPSPPPILPVVFIPGSKGSVLKKGECKDGQIVWGTTKSVWLSALDDLLIPLPPESDKWDLKRFEQNIQSCDIVDAFDVRVFLPFQAIFEYPIYSNLMKILKDAGGFDRNKGNVFYFHYDWRLDTRIAALELVTRLPEYRFQYYQKYLTQYCAELLLPFERCLATLQQTWPTLFGPDGIKFNVVAHSLGGLVAGYFVRGLGRGPEIEQLILIAAPTEGALFPMRIAVEGELALGDPLIHFYDKKETRPIGISFPSLFQALPRYRSALKQLDGRSPSEPAQRELALVDDLSLNADQVAQWAPAAAEHWLRMLDFDVDSWGLICRRSHTNRVGKCRQRMALHLTHELRSAVGFQQTITRGFCGTENEPFSDVQERQVFERKRLEEAWSVLPVIRPSTPRNLPPVEPAPCPTDADQQTRKQKLTARENPAAIVQFFGHCDATPTFALVSREADRLRLDFCEGRDSERDLCSAYGDGRISRTSMQALWRYHPEQRPSEITVCASHVDIVKDPTVQDNLLRLLVGERGEPIPAKRAR